MSKWRYRFLGFMTLDYKALQAYLNQMGQEGYELMELTKLLPIGKFKRKEEEKPKSYYVDIFQKQEAGDYIALCEDSGWEYLKAIGSMRVFKQREGYEAIPIQTDEEIEAKIVSKAFLNKELLPYCLWLPLLFVQFIGQFMDFDYRRLLSYCESMLLFLVPLVMLYLGVVVATWLIYRGQVRRAKEQQDCLKSPSIRGARVRGYLSYGYIGLLIFMLLVSYIGDFANEPYIILASVMPLVVLFIGTYCIGQGKRKKKIGILLLAGSLVLWPILTIGLIRSGDKSKNNSEIQREAASYPVLTLEAVNGKKAQGDLVVRLEKGHSFFVKQSYHYIEGVRHEELAIPRIQTQYIEARTFFIAEVIFEDMFKQIEDKNLKAMDESLYDAEEVYYCEARECLLLKKGRVIIQVEGFEEEEDCLNEKSQLAIKKLLTNSYSFIRQ